MVVGLRLSGSSEFRGWASLVLFEAQSELLDEGRDWTGTVWERPGLILKRYDCGGDGDCEDDDDSGSGGWRDNEWFKCWPTSSGDDRCGAAEDRGSHESGD